MNEAEFIIQVLMDKHSEYLEMPDIDSSTFMMHILASRLAEAIAEIEYLRKVNEKLSRQDVFNQ
jgi:hypothetical protein